jgi:signal transduction histidine kinase
LAAIGQMVAGVAHESRNALQQIQACARMLEWELDGNQSIQSLIADLQAAQDRLHRLFDDLRGYASPLRLSLRPCRIQPLFVQAWASVETLRMDRDASWRDTSPDESLHCLADAFQLEQVFRNILENALAACEDPVMIEVEYHLKETNESRWLRTTIRDNGPGLSSEQQQRIFEPFYTTRTQGTGLGMAIVKQIVEAHGGTIEARCGKSGGTEIVIALPLSVHAPLSNEEFVERFHA